MKKHKNKIVAGIVVAVILAISLWYGGNTPNVSGGNDEPENISVIQNEEAEKEKVSAISEIKENSVPEDENLITEDKNEMNSGVTSSEDENQSEAEINGSEHLKKSDEINKENIVNEPQAESVTAEPEKPEDSVIPNKEYTCTLSVSCGTILNNIELLDKEKVDIVPENGIIFAEKTVTFYEGESVFNVLLREMKRNKIHLEFVNTPVFNSAYIEGINNIYEFDCGELSGWMYKVNGWFPNYGCSLYQLKDGDRIEWVYTCDLGNDIGGSNFEKGSRHGGI